MSSTSLINIPWIKIAYKYNIGPPVFSAAINEEIIHNFGKYWSTSHEWHYIHNQYHCVANWDHVKEECFDNKEKLIEFLFLDVLTHQSIIHYLETHVKVNNTVSIHYA